MQAYWRMHKALVLYLDMNLSDAPIFNSVRIAVQQYFYDKKISHTLDTSLNVFSRRSQRQELSTL